MSWSIAVVANTLKIPSNCAEELSAIKDGDLWSDAEDVTNKHGCLEFPVDFNEGIDIINPDGEYPDVMKTLLEHKVKGEVCFADVEGRPQQPSFWGYRFDGLGGVKELEGSLVWKENAQVLKGMTVVITGTLPKMSREQAERAVRNAGGKVSSSVTRKTNLLVAGQNPGSKLGRAIDLGVRTINEQEFVDLLKK